MIDRTSVLDHLRASPWLALALVMLAVVALIAPWQVGVLLWSLTKLAFGAYLGYWIDRSIFPYARPHEFGWLVTFGTDEAPVAPGVWMLFAAAQLRRALIIGAAVLALGLGV